MKSKNIAVLITSTFVIIATGLAAQAATFTLSPKGQELLFDKTTLKAKKGEKIKLTFKNTAGMQHNWVLVAPGTAEKVAMAGITAGADKGWLPTTPDVLAHTKLVEPKQSDTIEFVAPSTPGEYPYICSFPGHASTMHGVLIVK